MTSFCKHSNLQTCSLAVTSHSTVELPVLMISKTKRTASASERKMFLLDIVHFLGYILYARRYRSWLCSRLWGLIVIIILAQFC
jgi:hypothetical protein